MKHKRTKPEEYYKILFLRTLGNFLLFSSLFIIAKTFYLPVSEEIKYFVENWVGKRYVVSGGGAQELPPPPKGGLAQVFERGQVEVLIPDDPQFSVVIPKIGANARILPNVDASDKDAYLSALQNGVAHTLGTTFPGEGGHIFLFAHSTDYFWNVGSYNAVFYLLYKLEKGDEIDVFYKGQRHVYQVVGSQIVDPSQVEYLTRKSNKEFLTLQTCWPPGTTLKRLLVFAQRVVD